MIDYNENEWEKIAALKELQREKEKKEIALLEGLTKLPFYLRIQAPGQEEVLQRVESNQRDTFIHHSAKKWGVDKKDIEELFQEYFTEFLNGKTKSIREFLISRGYKHPTLDLTDRK